MGAIYHKNKPYTRDVVTDSELDLTSNNAVKNSAITRIINIIKGWIGITIGPVSISSTSGGVSTLVFTNSSINSTSELHLFSENANNVPVFWTSVAVSDANHTATYTMPALTTAQAGTVFYLKIKNSWQI